MWQVKENVRIAWRAITGNKLRSLLTLAGIIMGIFSVVVMVGIGSGLKNYIENTFNELGSNLIFLSEGAESAGESTELKKAPKHIYQEDVDAILREAPAVIGVAPEVEVPDGVVKKGSAGVRSQVRGVTPTYESVRSYPIEKGRFISQEDLDGRVRVAIVGRDVYEKLFKFRNPIGEDISVNGVAFTVVGVLKKKGEQQDEFSTAGNVVFIPITTAQQRFLGIDYFFFVNVQASSYANSDKAIDQIRQVLRKRHNLVGAQPDDFNMFAMNEIVSRVNVIILSFNAVFGSLALISLVTGGIGIMNIMLVTVTERTREIGLRKAVGARRRDIMTQFLFESSVLSLVGGAFGILLAWLGIMGIRQIKPLTSQMGSPTFST
ncbi:MAG: ABC transporter permease, partial [bacterium]